MQHFSFAVSAFNKVKGLQRHAWLSSSALQHPKLGVKQSVRPHAGLIHLGLIHGRHTSQRMGPVVASPVLHKWQRTLLKRATRMSSRPIAHMRQRLHILTAAKCLEDVLFWMAQHELSL